MKYYSITLNIELVTHSLAAMYCITNPISGLHEYSDFHCCEPRHTVLEQPMNKLDNSRTKFRSGTAIDDGAAWSAGTCILSSSDVCVPQCILLYFYSYYLLYGMYT